MASSVTQRGNTVYIAADGSGTTPGAVTIDVNKKLKMVIFTPDAANDNLVLQETSGTSVLLNLKAATAKDTVIFNFSDNPIVFPTGVYCATLSANATATLILE